MLKFTGERIVPEADNCEPTFAKKMYQEHINRYMFAAQFCQGKKVLDIGCGVGYGSRFLSENGAEQVVAFDIAEAAIEHAREYYSNDNISYSVKSAEDFSFDEKFDVVTCFELIEHVHLQDAVLKNIRKVLKDDGLLLMSTPRALEHKRVHYHTKEFSFVEYEAFLKKEFSHVKFFMQNNHFSSMICDTYIDTVKLGYATDKLDLAHADYFISLASQQDIILKETAPSILVLNSDEYVLNLEKDVAILHKAEEDLKAVKAAQTQELRQQKEAVGNLQQEINEKNYTILKKNMELASLQQAIHAMENTISWKVTRPLRCLSAKIRSLKKKTDAAPAVKTKAASVQNIEVEAPIKDLDFLFINGCTIGESQRYRVFNIVAALESLGQKVEISEIDQVKKYCQKQSNIKTIIIFRAPYETDIIRLIDLFRKKGTKIIYDADDLIFDEQIVQQVRGVELLDDAEKVLYVDGVRRYAALMRYCDGISCSTEYLAKYAETKIKRHAFTVPNSFNQKQKEISQSLHPRKNKDEIVIGYFSGSKTHHIDFEECEAALYKTMEKYKQVKFLLVGHFELGEQWDAFADRIEKIDFVHYEKMLELLARVDINLAPLEKGNPFCEGKSELKFFEAALVQVPTIASKTATYLQAIEHGRTGMLADSPAEWLAALTAFVEDPVLRENIGKQACAAVSECYEQTNAARVLLEHIAQDDFALAKECYTINWIVPGMIIGGGGHRNIFRAAYFLSKFGHRVRLYFTDTEMQDEELGEKLRENFYPIYCPTYHYAGEMEKADVVFSTHWSTVAVAMQHKSSAKKLMYFVQDFEPSFASMGTEYILSENTYRMGMYHICSGPWCAKILRRDFQAEADYFQFPVDTSIYYPRTRMDSKPRLIYFAKPEMPRRCYELGVQALAVFHQLCPEVEIVFFGSRHVDPQQVPFPVTVKALLPTLDDLAELYSNGDLGLVFSTTNPSLIPYEMLACGLPIVDLGRPGNEVNYAERTDIALLANPLPAIMGKEIAALFNDKAALKKRRENGIEFVKSFPSEEKAVQRIESLIKEQMKQR